MTSQSTIHDRVNLQCLVRRLEQSADEKEWGEDGSYKDWIKIQGTLQKVKYAKKLLERVERYEFDPSRGFTQRYQAIQNSIQRMESFYQAVELRLTPKPVPVESLLSQIPSAAPRFSETTQIDDSTALPLSQDAPFLPQVEDSARGGKIPSSESSPFPIGPTTFRSHPVTSSALKTTSGTQEYVEGTSTALQTELTSQLAIMATQLKRNAIHFSESLEKDQAIVASAQEKIEQNYDVMKKERTRLRDHSGKSRGTTCLVAMSLIVVITVFVLMIFIIRFI